MTNLQAPICETVVPLLTQFIRRLAVCLLALAVGVSAAIVLLLLVSSPPAHAQATEGQTRSAQNTAPAESLPAGASGEERAVARNHLTRGGSIGSTSLAPLQFSPSRAKQLTTDLASESRQQEM
jgi:hypothetical protein